MGLLTTNEIKNPDLFKKYDKKDSYLKNLKQRLKDSKYKILFFSICVLMGVIVGLFDLFWVNNSLSLILRPQPK